MDELMKCPICGLNWYGNEGCKHNNDDVFRYAHTLHRQLEVANEALEIISGKTIAMATTVSGSMNIKMDYLPTEEASIAKNTLSEIEKIGGSK